MTPGCLKVNTIFLNAKAQRRKTKVPCIQHLRLCGFAFKHSVVDNIKNALLKGHERQNHQGLHVANCQMSVTSNLNESVFIDYYSCSFLFLYLLLIAVKANLNSSLKISSLNFYI